MTTREKPLTISIKPTWAGLLPALLMIWKDGTPEGRREARPEFDRMAKAADLYNAPRVPEQYVLSEEERRQVAHGRTVFLFNDEGECFSVLLGYNDLDGVSAADIEKARHINNARREGGE